MIRVTANKIPFKDGLIKHGKCPKILNTSCLAKKSTSAEAV